MARKQSNAVTKPAASSEPANTKPTRRPRRRKNSRSRKPRQLAAPVPVVDVPNEPAADGLLGFLSSKPTPEPNPTPAPKADGESSSASSPLPAEVEQQLAAVPDVIGGATPEAAAAEGESFQDTGITELLAAVAFEEQDVRDLLEELFERLAARFESDHWRLSERQSRILGKPSAQLANSIWAKLRDRIPEILARWCEETPGAVAFLTACGIVIVPKVVKQFNVSRTRKRELIEADRPAVPTVGRKHAPQPPTRTPDASFVTEYQRDGVR